MSNTNNTNNNNSDALDFYTQNEEMFGRCAYSPTLGIGSKPVKAPMKLEKLITKAANKLENRCMPLACAMLETPKMREAILNALSAANPLEAGQNWESVKNENENHLLTFKNFESGIFVRVILDKEGLSIRKTA